MYVCLPVPVSKPAVSQMCLSPEQMNISCCSEGDEVEFNVTLNSLLLVQSRGHSQSPSNRTANIKSPAGSKAEHEKPSVSNVTISIHSQQTGNLTCHVWNPFSRSETVINLKSCKGTVFKGCLLSFLNFSSSLFHIWYSFMKKQNH